MGAAPRVPPGAAAAAAVLAVAGLRLALGARLGLGDDEAYYWAWSRALDWGYLDHPPAVAWLLAASTALLGDTPLAVRLPSTLASLVASAGLAALGAELGEARAGRRAALAFQLVPLTGLASAFASPDLPFLAAWTWGWWAVARAARTGRGWAVAGLLAGAAALCKYFAIFLPLGAVGLLGPAGLRRRGPWLAAALALAVFSPVLAWNAAHGWAGLAFHLAGRRDAALGPVAGPLALLGSQLLLVSPVLAVLALAGLRRAPGRRLLVWGALPTLLLVLARSAAAGFKPHWTAGAWTLLLLAAGASSGPRAWAAGLALAGALQGAVLLQAATGLLPLPPAADPTVEMLGWDALGRRLAAELDRRGGAAVAGHMYQVSAQIEWALRDRPGVRVLRLGGRVDQYSVWGRDRARGPVILVDHDRYPYPAEEPRRAAVLGLAGCEVLGPPVVVSRRGRPVRTFRLRACRPAAPRR